MTALSVGVMFGLTAGIAPGPLMTLVVAQTLQHGVREGLLVAAAPLLTDAPIILVSLFMLRTLAHSERALAAIGAIGGVYILYLAYQTWRARPPDGGGAGVPPGSLRKGVVVNALSPHPYVFWGTVGAPFLLRTVVGHPAAPWLFIAVFYLLLVGAKIVVALMVARYRGLLTGTPYPYLMRGLAVTLTAFAVFLFRDALRLLDAP